MPIVLNKLCLKRFCDEYASGKVSDCCSELDRLSEISKSQPQAAYTAFIHGQQGKFSYSMRTIQEMHDHMLKLDGCENWKSPMAITSGESGYKERKTFVFSACYNGWLRNIQFFWEVQTWLLCFKKGLKAID